METHFLLADNVYCKASVPPTDKVCLWLGVSMGFRFDLNYIFPPFETQLSGSLIMSYDDFSNASPQKANVMLEYNIDEAQALLEKNLSTASRNLETLEEDLDYLRDQGTTTEVSIL